MSIDQALLESVDAGGPPTLRFYQWSVPTLSLGYFQRLDERLDHPESEPLVGVRRATGGGAIVHHHELTYSLAVPLRQLHVAGAPGSGAGSSTVRSRDLGGRVELYRSVHAAVLEALRSVQVNAASYAQVGGRLGESTAFLCFQRRTAEDLVLSGYKIFGSAQRRGRTAIVQHGSLLLKASPFAAELPGVSDLTSLRIDLPSLLAAWTAELASRLGMQFQPAALTAEELANVQAIARDRFATRTWLTRR